MKGAQAAIDDLPVPVVAVPAPRARPVVLHHLRDFDDASTPPGMAQP